MKAYSQYLGGHQVANLFCTRLQHCSDSSSQFQFWIPWHRPRPCSHSGL